MNRPFVESCEQNRDVIHQVIQPYLKPGIEVLEIASGTGQHAVYFADLNPQIRWQTSDRAEYLPGIQSWLTFTKLQNLIDPILLDVCLKWPSQQYDLIFTANSLHIMDDAEARACINGTAQCLEPSGFFIAYGPFNYNGGFTSESNRRFEDWLKLNNPKSGIKHFEVLNEIAEQSGLKLYADITMPANNRILIWQLETLPDN
ncbi:MAG: DUF938 domain-containing protein [Gammaproteobacteria bacterium]|nr:DUF938 domain-containing protein [Gammaproteobacteria bacterium]